MESDERCAGRHDLKEKRPKGAMFRKYVLWTLTDSMKWFKESRTSLFLLRSSIFLSCFIIICSCDHVSFYYARSFLNPWFFFLILIIKVWNQDGFCLFMVIQFWSIYNSVIFIIISCVMNRWWCNHCLVFLVRWKRLWRNNLYRNSCQCWNHYLGEW